ncbi:hypothetical protein [Bacillus sp. V33-4]|uniref:hypothetical protein n=1 Tax=Bacillus sp. V33-4 TaxID=2054169 RepID=UPI000C7821B9|nr:hypothetical protein [Bacillus sp. V33-4]PLR86443.1 hypothetical protein CVD23_06415 [Bacillus sp. V33-4]
MITGEMLVKYYELNKKKKEIELEMNQLKDTFHHYFDDQVGSNDKGEITIDGYKLQRQIRKTEKFNEEETVKRLEELQMTDLIKVVKKPDDIKIKSAINLGLIKTEDLEGCILSTTSPAITVKPVTPR